MKAAVIGKDNDLVTYYIANQLVRFGRDVILVANADRGHPLLKDLPFLTVDPNFNGTVDECVALTETKNAIEVIGRAVVVIPHPYKSENMDKETKKVKEDTVPLTHEESHIVASLPDWVILRVGELYGNGIEGWIMNTCRKALQGSAIVVYPKRRNYLMIFNLLEYLVPALTKPEAKNQIINMADQGAVFEQGMANTINIICNRNSGDVKVARSDIILRNEDASEVDMDLSKMIEILGEPTHPTLVGLSNVLKYAIDTMNNVDEHTRNALYESLSPVNVKS